MNAILSILFAILDAVKAVVGAFINSGSLRGGMLVAFWLTLMVVIVFALALKGKTGAY